VAFMKKKNSSNSVVNTVATSALAYLTRRVSQTTRNQYTGEVKDEKNHARRRIRVAVSLRHQCGQRIIESEGISMNASLPAANLVGVALAKKLIIRINDHGRDCTTKAPPVPRLPHTEINAEWIGDPEPAPKPKTKPKPKKECEICGEQDQIKYPEWPECEHVQDKRKVREGNKEVRGRTESGKSREPEAKSRVQRAKDRTTERQSAMDSHVRTKRDTGRRKH